MTLEDMAFILSGFIAALILVFLMYRYLPRRLRRNYFQIRWKVLQDFCKDKKTWRDAIIAADKLLDKALRKKRFKGRSMGERLVSAQRLFTDNDGVWHAHKLRKHIEQRPKSRLKEAEVKKALIAIRQALKDLGALE